MAPEVLAQVEKQLRSEGRQVPGWVVAGQKRLASPGRGSVHAEVGRSGRHM